MTPHNSNNNNNINNDNGENLLVPFLLTNFLAPASQQEVDPAILRNRHEEALVALENLWQFYRQRKYFFHFIESLAKKKQRGKKRGRSRLDRKVSHSGNFIEL